jgi:hypothetical protein
MMTTCGPSWVSDHTDVLLKHHGAAETVDERSALEVGPGADLD